MKRNNVHLNYLMKVIPLFHSKQLFSRCEGKGKTQETIYAKTNITGRVADRLKIT